MKRAIKFLLGIAASVFFVFLLFRSISFNELKDSFKNIHIIWVFISLIALFLAYFLRIKRSQIMLSPLKPEVTFTQSALPFMISVAANNVLPFRAGDALRVVKFSSWLKISITSMIAIMFVEHLMDLLAVIAAFGVTLSFSSIQKNSNESVLLHSGSFLLILMSLAIVLLLLFPKFLYKPAQWIINASAKLSPFLARKIQPHIDGLFKTLEIVTDRYNIIRLLGYSVLSWFFEAAAFYIAACSVPEITHKAAGWLAMPVGTLSTVLPASPGYVGTFHYFVRIAMQALGNTAASSTAYAILIHFILWIPVTIVGAGCFVYWVFCYPDKRCQ